MATHSVSAKVPVVGYVEVFFEVESDLKGEELDKHLADIGVGLANEFLYGLEAKTRCIAAAEIEGHGQVEVWSVEAMRAISQGNFFFGDIEEIKLDIDTYEDEED